MDKLVTTNVFKERDRFPFWHDSVCETIFPYKIKLKDPDQPFFGTIVSDSLKNFSIIRAKSVSQELARTPGLISRAREETIGFCYLVQGYAGVSQDNRKADLKPGNWVICDSTRPFTWALPTPHHHLLALSIPKNKMTPHLPNIEEMTAIALQGTSGLGKIIWKFAESILEELNNAGNRARPRIEDTIIDLLTAYLDDQFQLSKKSQCSDTVRLIELKSFIKDHLRDPNLCVEMISEAFQVSTRYCHTLFQTDEKSISQYIRELRLIKCKKSLEDPILLNKSITDISFSWGFNNSSHFSKLFKKYFGISPKELRPLTFKG